MQEVERRASLADAASTSTPPVEEQYASTHPFYERCGYRLVASLPDF